jgi:L-malate glycosyltransferase
MSSKEKIKLLILNYEYPPIGGGGGVSSQKIARELVKTGKYSITILTSCVGDKTVEYDEVDNLKIIRLNCARKRKSLSTATNSYMLTYIVKAIIYSFLKFKKNQFDIMHTHFAIPTGPAGLFISKYFKLKNILTLHGGEFFKQPLEIELIDNYFIKKSLDIIINNADYLTANSNDTKNAANSIIDIKKEIHVLTLGFEKPIFKFDKKEKRKNTDEIKLVTVSRIVARKGYHYLINALSKLKEYKWELIFIGEGPELDSLKQLIKESDLDNRIKFAGFISDEEKYNLLNNSDIYVLPTLHEGLGLVYFEAMYCGLPIITTDNGGQTDFLKQNLNALMTPIKNVEKLMEAIEFAIKNKDWRIQAGQNNKEAIKKLYLEETYKLYDNFIEKVMRNEN